MIGTYGALDHNRIFYAKNPNALSPTPYAIRGSYLSNIIFNMKDVVPIYQVTATISGAPFAITSITVSDMRRYISNGYNGLNDPFTLGANASFRTFSALNTYLTSLNGNISRSVGSINKISDTVLVKDSIDITGQIFNTGGKVKFIGDGGKLTMTNTSYMTNVSLNNLRVEVSGTNGIFLDGYLNSITDSNIIYTGSVPIDGYTIIIDLNATAFISGNYFKGPLATAHILNLSNNKMMVSGNRYQAINANIKIMYGGVALLPGGTQLSDFNANDG
jgi:hypothetical protein